MASEKTDLLMALLVADLADVEQKLITNLGDEAAASVLRYSGKTFIEGLRRHCDRETERILAIRRGVAIDAHAT